MSEKIAVVAGGGPAGLTAALELLRQTNVRPLVFEMDEAVGGISKTVNHKGNRMDLGGHRFFSKSDWVMNWWQEILPVAADADAEFEISYQNKSRTVVPARLAGENDDDVMLVRSRLSRIYYLGKFFDYPMKLNLNTIRNLGLVKIARIGFSYLRARLLPISDEKSLEDFLINRFGRELYLTFFKEYTEKVWGKPCNEISSEWGAQRIKGLSITKAVLHALKQLLPTKDEGLSQEGTNTSLIQRFLYPKYGPGHMWQRVSQLIEQEGGTVQLHHKVERLFLDGDNVEAVEVRNLQTGETRRIGCDYFISTMPVQELITSMSPAPDSAVVEVANGLEYRDFVTVGLLFDKLKARPGSIGSTNLIPDNWIYVQDRGVKLGRIQIFNNWSPYLVPDKNSVWLGLEYFCDEGDELWEMPDEELVALARNELEQISFVAGEAVRESHVHRVVKAYPGYFGSYENFDVIRKFSDSIGNLFLVGRNGMHRYNNQDHSMLTARYAVEAIAAGDRSKDAIWDVNIDDEYHEEVSEESQRAAAGADSAAVQSVSGASSG